MSTTVAIQMQMASDAVVSRRATSRSAMDRRCVVTADGGTTHMYAVQAGIDNAAEVQILDRIQPGTNCHDGCAGCQPFDIFSVSIAPPAVAASDPGGIKVSANHLVGGDGNPIQLIGVNRSGAEPGQKSDQSLSLVAARWAAT